MFEAIKAGLGKLFTPTTWYGVVALAISLLLYYVFEAAPDKAAVQGQRLGQAECIATSASAAVATTVAGAASAASQAETTLARGNKASGQREQARARIDTIFHNLEAEARHDPSHPVDACVLPPDRLRRWAAANAGPTRPADPDDQGGAASQPDAAAPATDHAPLGGDARPGGRPQGGGQAVPPVGRADVRPPEVPGDRAP